MLAQRHKHLYGTKREHFAEVCIDARAVNDWAIEYQRFSPRYVPTATIPLLSTETAVAEVHRAAGLGFHAGYLSVVPPIGAADWNYDVWEPLWAAMEETGMVVAFHIGTEPHDAASFHGSYFRGH